jgi:hypothetical protein
VVCPADFEPNAAQSGCVEMACAAYTYEVGVEDGDLNTCASGGVLAFGASCNTKCSEGYTANANAFDFPGDFLVVCDTANRPANRTAVCAANFCAATQVAHSDKATARSITGSTTVAVPVVCDAGYFFQYQELDDYVGEWKWRQGASSAGGDTTCSAGGAFKPDVECRAKPCLPYTYPVGVTDASLDSCESGGLMQEFETCGVRCKQGYTDHSSPGGATIQCPAPDTAVVGTPSCAATYCAATQIPNSDKAAQASISGVTLDVVAVACDEGYNGGGAMTCGPGGAFGWTAGRACEENQCLPTQVRPFLVLSGSRYIAFMHSCWNFRCGVGPG